MNTRWEDLVLSLLVPGAGQLRQRRTAAGIGFLFCTLAALLGLAWAERLSLPGWIPLVVLAIAVVWSAVDAWRHGAFDHTGTR